MVLWFYIFDAAYIYSFKFKFLILKRLGFCFQIIVMYEPFLHEGCRDYMRRFAAESLSYLMRKIKDKRQLFKILFSLLKKNEELVAGVGNLIFEMVKGPKRFFHS